MMRSPFHWLLPCFSFPCPSSSTYYCYWSRFLGFDTNSIYYTSDLGVSDSSQGGSGIEWGSHTSYLGTSIMPVPFILSSAHFTTYTSSSGTRVTFLSIDIIRTPLILYQSRDTIPAPTILILFYFVSYCIFNFNFLHFIMYLARDIYLVAFIYVLLNSGFLLYYILFYFSLFVIFNYFNLFLC